MFRAAASRCRAKKKVWVEDMEKRSKEMDMLNQALQQEVISLRSEVQQLKSILIAHKDCPLIVHQTVGTPASKGGGREALYGRDLSHGFCMMRCLECGAQTSA